MLHFLIQSQLTFRKKKCGIYIPKKKINLKSIVNTQKIKNLFNYIGMHKNSMSKKKKNPLNMSNFKIVSIIGIPYNYTKLNTKMKNPRAAEVKIFLFSPPLCSPTHRTLLLFFQSQQSTTSPRRQTHSFLPESLQQSQYNRIILLNYVRPFIIGRFGIID